ncbi:MAG: TIGR02452 family protein [Eubacterium sp.]|nr:TIGR02452 family protein [Eubacterium sp.]
MYQDLRQERVAIFEETRRLCQTDQRLADAIERAKQRQKMIAEGEPLSVPDTLYDTPAEVIVSQKRSLAAAEAYTGKKICVMNFASATNAGGGVEKGASAQEEGICRCSTLYPCISDKQIVSRFHYAHRSALHHGRLSVLYNDDCIYTPGVIVFRSDTRHPQLLPKERWYEIDVVSCAAPNLRSKPGNAMNPDAGSKPVTIGKDELRKLHKKRIGRIMDIAGCFGVQVMIVGAFGCGAFQNPPEAVAEAMREVITEHRYRFQTIEAAVYCPVQDTTNYDVFKKIVSL